MAQLITHDDARAQHPQYTDSIEAWEICRDFADGELRVKNKGPDYLPKLSPTQNLESYQDYLLRAKFLPLFRRTVETLAGAAVRNPAEFKGDAQVSAAFNDIDGKGGTLDGFISNLIRELLTVGRAAIFVDVNSDGKPFWSLLPGDELISWWTLLDEQQCVQSRHVFKPAGDWSVNKQKEWRVFRQKNGSVFLTVYTEGKNGELTEESSALFANVRGEPIWPIVPLTAYVQGTYTPDVPPLLGLALLNRNHYLKSADQARGLHWVGFATPYITAGADDLTSPIEIGPNSLIQLPLGATIGMLETEGMGLEALANDLMEIKHEAESLGARILAPSVYGTATAERISAAAETASLGSITDVAEQAINAAAIVHAQYLGIASPTIEVTLNRNFAGVDGEDGLPAEGDINTKPGEE